MTFSRRDRRVAGLTRCLGAAAVGAVLWAGPLGAQETADNPGRDSTVYAVKAGDTISEIARRFLGSAACAPELLKYNNVSNPLVVAEGMLLAIPGVRRARALSAFDEAKAALTLAVEAQGATYAAEAFDRARQALQNAETAWNDTSYMKAEGLCLLSVQYAEEAVRVAEVRANVQQECLVTTLHGDAEAARQSGGNWVAVREGDRLPVASLLRTRAGARAELTMPDGSKTQVAESSELQIDGLLKDQRTQRMRIQLTLRLGEIMNRVQPLRRKDSLFEIKSGESATAVRGTELRVGESKDGTSRIMTLTGEVLTSTKRWAMRVGANRGMWFKKDQKPADPIELLPPPVAISLRPERFVSAVQILEFRWNPVGERPLVRYFKRPYGPYSVPRATRYRFEIARDTAFTRVIQNDCTVATRLTSTVLAPGDYYWRLASIDANDLEGRWGKTGVFSIKRDLGVSLTTDQTPVAHAGRLLARTGVIVQAAPRSAATSVARLEYSIDGQPFRRCEGQLRLNGAGECRVQVRGVGADGVAGPVAELTLAIDAQPPELEIHLGRPTETASKVKHMALTLTAVDDSGVARIETSVDGAGFATYSGPLDLLCSSSYDVAIRAVDIVGNVSPTRVLRIESSTLQAK